MMKTKQEIVVVTGGAGFVGSHLCERLVREGYRVISLDNYFTGSPANHVEGVEYREGHTKDIAKHITETPHIVYHLGEYARTEKSFEDIETVWDFNTQGTFAVLEFCRRMHCKLIYAGSSTKFADGGEGARQSPYAWTKAQNTELVKNYGEWFGLSYAITYFYNVYGPREMSGPYGTLISIFAELYAHGRPLTVVAPGTQLRNFTHVFDIVEGLVLVGEKGIGDGYGIGAPTTYSVMDVAMLFGGEILLMPERKGNRMLSIADTKRTEALGWSPTHTLPEYISEVKVTIGNVTQSEKRVLVFAPTFYPNAGKAEEALYDLLASMPSVQFDIITTFFSKEGKSYTCPLQNVSVYRVGRGKPSDKYLLPIMGRTIAQKLVKEHSYIFYWALFASYGALTAIVSRTRNKPSLLITTADQRMATIPWYTRLLIKQILGKADQVYAQDTYEKSSLLTLAKRTNLVRTMGDGDTFANQLRFAYSTFLKKRTEV